MHGFLITVITEKNLLRMISIYFFAYVRPTYIIFNKMHLTIYLIDISRTINKNIFQKNNFWVYY